MDIHANGEFDPFVGDIWKYLLSDDYCRYWHPDYCKSTELHILKTITKESFSLAVWLDLAMWKWIWKKNGRFPLAILTIVTVGIVGVMKMMLQMVDVDVVVAARCVIQMMQIAANTVPDV